MKFCDKQGMYVNGGLQEKALVNYFVKPNEQKTSLLGLCLGEE